MDFNNIIGHEKSIKILQNSINNGKISHSYLFEGGEGIGKQLVARVFAKTLLCEKQDDRPCNQCTSCMKVDNSVHPDLIIINPEKNLIKKEQIEALIEATNSKPFEGLRKIFIVNDSHLMNIQSQNALLKTLEEPPEYVNIILITNMRNRLLDTILSRLEIVKFYEIGQEEIREYLEDNYSLGRHKSEFLANFANGSLGKAKKYAEDDKFFKLRNEVLDIIDSLMNKDLSRAFSSFDFFNENKEYIDDLLDISMYWFRDIIMYKELGENSLLINKDRMEKIEEQSYMNFDKINAIINIIEETKINIKRHINYQLAIERMLLNIGGKE